MRRSFAACLAGLVLAWSPGTSLQAHRADPILVFAASSLTNVLDAMKPDLVRAAGAPVTMSYASSATLARQIDAGAPADVFISADQAWMEYLASRKLVRAGDVVRLARNRLVLIAPAASNIQLAIRPGFALSQALGKGRLAVGDPASVPAGKYARSALEALGAWATVQDRLAPGENVRVALQFVARGECPLGIVYATDAKAEPAVRVVDAFPDAVVTPPIAYPAALTAARSNPAAARLLLFLGSADAKRTLQRFGFIVD
jgi:molybdate transport system substrate-binding protein